MKKLISFIIQHFKNNKKWYFIWILAITSFAIIPFINKEETEYTKANECINQQLALVDDPEVTQFAKCYDDFIKNIAKEAIRDGMSIGTFGISRIGDYIEDKIVHINEEGLELKLKECNKIISSSKMSVKEKYNKIAAHCIKDDKENDGLSDLSDTRIGITELSEIQVRPADKSVNLK